MGNRKVFHFPARYFTIKLYLCSNRFRHASHRTAYQGGTFTLYRSMEYTKQPIDYPQQIQLLKERGLIIKDKKQALEQLRIISYFRLADYLRPMEEDKRNHIFKRNSTFKNALNLYYFDKELRALIFTAFKVLKSLCGQKSYITSR